METCCQSVHNSNLNPLHQEAEVLLADVLSVSVYATHIGCRFYTECSVNGSLSVETKWGGYTVSARPCGGGGGEEREREGAWGRNGSYLQEAGGRV